MKLAPLSVCVLLAACSRTAPAPNATVEPSAPSSAAPSASAPAASSAPPAPGPPSVFAHERSYDHLCPELAGTTAQGEAGAARPPTATDLMVSAKMKTVKKDFVASIAVPAKRVDREVFRMGTEGDPFQCCSRASGDALDVTCWFSGIDIIEGRAQASVDGSDVVIRWCKADLSTATVMDRGEERVLRGGAPAWYGASTPACAPKLPQ